MTAYKRTALLAPIILMAPLAIGFADEAPDFSGAELYQQFCASCHGARAFGDGPAAAPLKTAPPDLTLIAKRHGGRFPRQRIHRIIDGQSMPAAHGSRDMPVWGWQFYGRDREDPAQRQRANELIERLVDYLRSIQR